MRGIQGAVPCLRRSAGRQNATPIESLENRRLLTTVVVNSLTDSLSINGSVVSLAAAVAIANTATTPTTITFDPTVFAAQQTIDLTIGALAFTNTNAATTIVGPASGVVIKNTLLGFGNQVMQVDTGVTATISKVIITGGTYAGIISQGNLTLTNSTVTGNQGYPSGGGLLTFAGNVNLTDDTFSNNTAEYGGGMYLVASTRATLTNVTISGNTTTGGGGGLGIGGAVVTLNDVTISNNNGGSGNGGGVDFLNNNSGNTSLTIANSIISANSSTDLSIEGSHSPVTSLGNNLIGFTSASDVLTASDIVGLNPQLGALANNGGLSATMLPLHGSPAIDAGSEALIPPGLATDQRGLPRIVGASVDIGAVEVQTTAYLSGIAIGTAGSWDGASTIQKVFDNKLSTYFDPSTGDLTDWVGLDLRKNATITQISFAPRAGYEFRMLSGQFQVSSTPDFSSDVHTIYTVTSTPTAGVLTTVNITPTAGYRYVRYTGGLQWVNIAEFKVFGSELPPAYGPTVFTGTPIGTAASWNPQSSIAAAFDANQSTFFDPATGSLTNWVGLDLGTPRTVTQITYSPRIGYEFRMNGGQFQVSSTPDFSADVHTLYKLNETPTDGLTTVTFLPIGAYQYVRYTGGTQWVNIAEMQVAGEVPPVPLTGTAIGSGGSWNANSTYAAAFDGNTSTFFDPADSGLTNWVGLDLGWAEVVTQIRFAPRAGYEFRMFGGTFQASDTADFSSGVVTLCTITTTPAAGQVTTVSVNPANTAYRYYRYTGGTQWVNIAEMELDGVA